ncbi:MAG: hypothetical protein M3083_03335 [Actinomycetota bacterium]|nr:hypothetical protein [Actinomycetota bacterium]
MRLVVDINQMQEVRNQLASIQSALQGAESINAYDCAIGSGKVEHALSDFISNWSQGRQKILDDIKNLLDRLDNAISTYQKEEQSLVDAGRSAP